MYNKSNAITCLKSRAKLFYKKTICSYLPKELELVENRAGFVVQVLIKFWKKVGCLIRFQWQFEQNLKPSM